MFFKTQILFALFVEVQAACVLSVLHCVQKKTTTHIFFHISMSDVWI